QFLPSDKSIYHVRHTAGRICDQVGTHRHPADFGGLEVAAFAKSDAGSCDRKGPHAGVVPDIKSALCGAVDRRDLILHRRAVHAAVKDAAQVVDKPDDDGSIAGQIDGDARPARHAGGAAGPEDRAVFDAVKGQAVAHDDTGTAAFAKGDAAAGIVAVVRGAFGG